MAGDKSKQNRTSQSQPALLKINNLKTPLFGPLNLSVAAGECVAIRGKSGAGKSIFLRAIADLDPNEGEVTLNGKNRNTMPANEWRRKVMLLPAESGWWADRVGEHFENTDNIDDLLEALSLPADIVTWLVRRLSTGERQRLGIARALALKPKILLMDEPTAALDPQVTNNVETLMRQQLANGVGIVLITHDPDQGRRLGDRRLLLEDGALVVERNTPDSEGQQP